MPRTPLLNGLMQSNLDANHYQIVNLDTSNLAINSLTRIPFTVASTGWYRVFSGTNLSGGTFIVQHPSTNGNDIDIKVEFGISDNFAQSSPIGHISVVRSSALITSTTSLDQIRISREQVTGVMYGYVDIHIQEGGSWEITVQADGTLTISGIGFFNPPTFNPTVGAHDNLVYTVRPSQIGSTSSLGSGGDGSGNHALTDDGTYKSVGLVSDIAVTTANGVSGTSNHNATTPSLTIALGSITPSSVVASGNITSSGGVFSGSGASLTSLNASNLSSGTVNRARLGTGSDGSGTHAIFDDGTWKTIAGGGSVLDVAVATANGVSGTSDHNATTPTLTLVLGAITPSSVTSAGAVQGATLIGAGSAITALNASNLASGTVSDARLSIELQRLVSITQTLSGAAPSIDWSLSTSFAWTLSANANPTFTSNTDNWDITVFILNTSGNYTVTWPAGIKWVGGVQPTQTVGAFTDAWTFKQKGSTIYGVAIQNFS